MALPRSKYVQEGQEGVYHCFSRCVRRAFLCGFDTLTNRDCSHRKAWLLERLHHLTTIFAIEVCAYAILRVPSMCDSLEVKVFPQPDGGEG